MPKEFQLLVYILSFCLGSRNDRLNEFVMLIYIYNNVMRSCNERTTIHCLESYLYYVILVNNFFFRRSENKIDNIHCIYIVENIKFIYTSFDEFFLPVSQRVEMNYIFSTVYIYGLFFSLPRFTPPKIFVY